MTENHEIKTDYDVLIIGGGLAGLSLSCLLGKIEGLRVACLDRDAPETQLKADQRTTAISYGSAQILKQSGVWETLQEAGCPIDNIEILDGDSPVLLQFLSREVEDNSFGWIIPNAHIRQTLMQKMKEHNTVDHLAPEKVEGFTVHDEYVQVHLESGQKLTASLVVGADGRGSSVRDYMDVPVRQWDYKQRAIVCFITHEKPHENKAVEHFMSGGPFAILPMNDLPDGRHCSSLVFTEHKNRKGLPKLMDLTDEQFHEEVESRFPESYGVVEIVDNKRMAFPLSLAHASEYIAPRMVLVADAAHGIHPIAGQGLNLGFRDLNTLSKLVEAAYKAKQDIGSDTLLQNYQRKRRPDNMAMLAATDALVRLFSNDMKSIKMLRQAGLKTVSRMGRAKKFFMRRAMGE